MPMRFLNQMSYKADLVRSRLRLAWRAWLLRQIDVEELILSCVPSGRPCDPEMVADAIREYFEP